MTNFESSPPNPLASEELIRELLDGHATAPRHYKDMMYAAALGELKNNFTPFDKIRKVLIEHDVPGAADIMLAEDYQTLLDDLHEGRCIEFQRSDGDYYFGVIDDEPKLDIYVDYPQSKTVPVIEIPIDYEGEVDLLPFYPRLNQDKELFIPGLHLH